MFTGKRVVVTGAGKGIGRATAVMLARRNARVIALSRSAEDLASLAAETGCRTIPVDLSDPEATRAAARAALPADLLVNNAGTTELDSFLDLPAAHLDLLYAVNLRAPMILAQEYARALVAEGRGGAIVNVSSMSAFIGFRDHAAYCASKAGLDGLTRVMAVELGPLGIRVNTVNPTVTLTPMAIKAWSDEAKAASMLSRIPLGRFAEPDDIAEVILFLLSDAAAMVHGVSLPVDGGYMVTP
jgi:NAD(P)-dependent dehydrogenase (short-subunit alcohol dehydrogenase family)